MNEKTVKKILEATPNIYDKVSDQFFQTRKKPWPVFDLLKDYVKSASSIIDFGCGSGRVAEIITDHQKYLGIDNSAELTKIAQTNNSSRKNISFQVGDIINFQPKEKCDLALLIASLHHIPTEKLQLQVLQNAYDSLLPNGTLFMTNWNLWQKQYRKHLFDYRTKFFKYKLLSIKDALIPWKIKNDWQYRYVHSFSKRELSRLLKKTGFAVKEIYFEENNQPTGMLSGKNLIAIAVKK